MRSRAEICEKPQRQNWSSQSGCVWNGHLTSGARANSNTRTTGRLEFKSCESTSPFLSLERLFRIHFPRRQPPAQSGHSGEPVTPISPNTPLAVAATRCACLLDWTKYHPARWFWGVRPVVGDLSLILHRRKPSFSDSCANGALYTNWWLLDSARRAQQCIGR